MLTGKLAFHSGLGLLAQAEGAGIPIGRSTDNQTLSDAWVIAAAGLVIVFSALILISLFIASLPMILRAVNRIWPEVVDQHADDGHPESQVADDPDVLAAIGFVLHTEFQRQLAHPSSPAGKN